MAEIDKRITPEQVEQIARICHEANRVVQMATGEEVAPPWESAPSWMAVSAMDGVRAIVQGQVNGPEESHQNWLREKERTGWKYGPVKDPERKEHPCMVPYAELPEPQRVKDSVFFTITNVLESALLGVEYKATEGAEMTLRAGIDKEGNLRVFRVCSGPMNGTDFAKLAGAVAGAVFHWVDSVDSSNSLNGAMLGKVVAGAFLGLEKAAVPVKGGRDEAVE